MISSTADKLNYNCEKILIYWCKNIKIKIMAAFKVPSSTKDPFSCQENSLTGHGKWGESSQLPEFLITNPSLGARDTGGGSGQEGVGDRRQEATAPFYLYRLTKCFPRERAPECKSKIDAWKRKQRRKR